MKIPNFTKRKPKITAGGETFTPEPMNLEQTVELVLLLAPFLPLVEALWPQFQEALKAVGGKRPYLLSAFFQVMAGQIEAADVTRAFAIVLGKPAEWFRGVRAVELVEALPVLDEVNKFDELIKVVGNLIAQVKND